MTAEAVEGLVPGLMSRDGAILAPSGSLEKAERERPGLCRWWQRAKRQSSGALLLQRLLLSVQVGDMLAIDPGRSTVLGASGEDPRHSHLPGFSGTSLGHSHGVGCGGDPHK